MTCYNCARWTLSSFIRSLIKNDPIFTPRPSFPSSAQQLRCYSTRRSPKLEGAASRQPKRHAVERSQEDTVEEVVEGNGSTTQKERPSWQVQKAALKEKLGGEAWNPRKKLSPDTMEGIRHLHTSQPDRFTTPVLANHFKVSPEAIRRILKSKWRPSDEEYEDRMRRWDKRGERIWSNLVEMGVKPPKAWREMGVGRTTNGERPKWKGRWRNMVEVKDSASKDFLVEEGDIIPIVGGSEKQKKPVVNTPLSRRL